MKIDEGLKNNLIADVENICMIDLSEETAEMLKRCFEITIGTHNLSLPLAEGAEEILAKHYPMELVFMDDTKDDIIAAMHEFAALTAGKMVEEKLREELIKYEKFTHVTPDHEFAVQSVDEYLKSRESHDR